MHILTKFWGEKINFILYCIEVRVKSSSSSLSSSRPCSRQGSAVVLHPRSATPTRSSHPVHMSAYLQHHSHADHGRHRFQPKSTASGKCKIMLCMLSLQLTPRVKEMYRHVLAGQLSMCQRRQKVFWTLYAVCCVLWETVMTLAGRTNFLGEFPYVRLVGVCIGQLQKSPQAFKKCIGRFI